MKSLDEALAVILVPTQSILLIIGLLSLAITLALSYFLSHEINDPIHNIQSALEAAQKKCNEPDKAIPFVHIAYEEIVRLARLVRQTPLYFYRHGSGE